MATPLLSLVTGRLCTAAQHFAREEHAFCESYRPSRNWCKASFPLFVRVFCFFTALFLIYRLTNLLFPDIIRNRPVQTASDGYMETYRSGHNGAHSKCVCLNGHESSNLSVSAIKACNHTDYRLFYFYSKSKACTMLGFRGRKSAVLPGTDRPPAAAEVAALRQSKPCRHRLRRGDLGLVIQVGVDIRRGGKVAVSQPLLNMLEGNAVGQQQAGAAVPLRYNYDKPEKPRISRAFGYLARFFILFQTEKSSREVVIS